MEEAKEIKKSVSALGRIGVSAFGGWEP